MIRMPEIPKAMKAYSAIVTEGSLTCIARVAKSRAARKTDPSIANIDAGINPSKPGRTINNTPIKPINTAVQRLQPTFSLKNITAPIVTNNGAICRIAVADERGVKAIAVTKKTAPKSSQIVRIITCLFNKSL